MEPSPAVTNSGPDPKTPSSRIQLITMRISRPDSNVNPTPRNFARPKIKRNPKASIFPTLAAQSADEMIFTTSFRGLDECLLIEMWLSIFVCSKLRRDSLKKKRKNMLDYLYTSQYQMRGILSISKKEDIVKFYENPFQLKVLEEHVTPYCHGRIILDFESEVEDEIIPIFRKGEEFNYGIEFVLLLAFSESASSGQTEDAMASFASMILEFPSLIVQSTQGRNFNINSTEYTDVVVIRLRSIEAFEIFVGSTEYKAMWKSKFEPITCKALAIHYSVDPVGTDIM
ncbi:unnamed protein product [Rhodiola kirilowii]